ncbi:MAG: DUF5666 domain-containing protein [Acidobacteriota bacterium]|nr:DUF5666 domain-containing protein [Acidobacteriota bacterium]
MKSLRTIRWLAVLSLFATPALYAQFGGRLPRRGTSTTSSERKPAVQTVTITGVVMQVNAGSLVVESTDTRIVTFKITEQTRFSEIARADLKPGDRLRVEATQDNEANLTATSVMRDTGEAPTTLTATDDGGDPDRPRLRRSGRAAEPKATEPPAEREPSKVETRRAPDPIPDTSREAEDNDPNRPKLRRGIPRARASATEPEEQPTPQRPVEVTNERNAQIGAEIITGEPDSGKPNDPLILRAMKVAESFSETLPNYVCQQFTTRYIRGGGGERGWRALDVVSANVVYENNKESYRNIMINGKPAKKAMEELPGSWSTGEFGTTLRSLLSPRTAADFRFRKESTVAGLNTRVYDYKVERLRSDWRIQLGSQAIIPGYSGRVWIDTKNARVLRIEMQADNIPEEFPLDKVEAANDYGFVKLGGVAEYLLPTHAENLSCQRGSDVCSRNSIDFRNYHKYSGEATIVFDK